MADFGIKISPPGYDVNTTADRDLAYTSKYDTPMLDPYFHSEITATASTTSYSDITGDTRSQYIGFIKVGSRLYRIPLQQSISEQIQAFVVYRSGVPAVAVQNDDGSDHDVEITVYGVL